MKKKLLGILLSVSLVAGMLIGCGSKETGTETGTEGGTEAPAAPEEAEPE